MSLRAVGKVAAFLSIALCAVPAAAQTVADLSITKSDQVSGVIPGQQITYTIQASNAGPQAVASAHIGDLLSTELQACSWTCTGSGGATCQASGSGKIADAIQMPASSAATYRLTCTVAPDAVGTIDNTATISATATDPVPGNNSATDTDTVARMADLAIKVDDHVASVAPGESVTYEIDATNSGPDNAMAIVSDHFPPQLICTWTCAGTGGGLCTSAGEGSISDGVYLPSDGSVTYTATCQVKSVASGMLRNVANIALNKPGTIDPRTENDESIDEDQLIPRSNLGLTLATSNGIVRVGDVVDYVVTVSNDGPSMASATVSDPLPENFDSGTWICSSDTGGGCSDGSGRELIDNPTLPVGARVEYIFSATVVADSVDGLLVNIADTAMESGNDPDTTNNIDEVTSEFVLFRDGFDDTKAGAMTLDSDRDYIQARAIASPALLASLTAMPRTFARATSADGKKLFDLQLAKLGDHVAVRALTPKANGHRTASGWKIARVAEDAFDVTWQRASAGTSNGYLRVSGKSVTVDVGNIGATAPVHALHTEREGAAPTAQWNLAQ